MCGLILDIDFAGDEVPSLAGDAGGDSGVKENEGQLWNLCKVWSNTH